MIDPHQLPPDLRELAQAVENPAEGFFGPRSVSWRIIRENVLLMGGPRALLLQLAHPHVAQGVAEHSQFITDPIGRTLRTFGTVYRMIFGSMDTALEVALRTRAIHSTVKGTLPRMAGDFNQGSRYHANRGDLLFWVHATLVDSSLYVYERTVGPLAKRDMDRYYEETKIFARLFGTPEKAIPATPAGFRTYMKGMINETLSVTPEAKELATALLRGPMPLFRPLSPGSYLLAGGSLPPKIRKAYGIPWNRALGQVYNQSLRAVRLALPMVPPPLRYQPAYRSAMKKAA